MEAKYAEVAVNAPVKNTFDYAIPDDMRGIIQLGHLVQVAFGTARQHGIIVGLRETTEVRQTKPLLELLDPLPVVSSAQIALARWLSEAYLAPLNDCLWLMLPPGLNGQRDILVTLLQPEATSTDPLESQIINLLKRRGAMRGQRLSTALPGKAWRGALDTMTRAKIVRKESILTPPRMKPKIVQTAALAIHPNQISAVARHLGKTSRRADLLEVIAAMRTDRPTVDQVLAAADVGTATLKKLAEEEKLVTIYPKENGQPATVSLAIPRYQVDDRLIQLRSGEKDLHVLKVLAREAEPIDISWLYAQTETKLADLKRLEEEGLVLLGEKQTWRDSLAEQEYVPTAAPGLTEEQQKAWDKLQAHIKDNVWKKEGIRPDGTFLLHGVTGSGKTEIYLRAIELVLAQGRQAVFLVPEIALTAQTVRRVASRFPGQVAVVHSGLKEGERYDTWRRARDGLIQVVVGARSALFTPLPDIGLVILDEEHDGSYKQSPPVSPPYYHTRQVAEWMMKQNNGIVILGSATPDIETYYRASRNDLQLLRMPRRVMGHRAKILEQAEREGVIARYRPTTAEDAMMIDLPPVHIVDMREELKSGNTAIFSRELHGALAATLERSEQAILFINRRGMSTFIFCRDCGYVAECPNCETPLTYHQDTSVLVCHRCAYQMPEPRVCPNCSSVRIKYFGAGTQQVEQAMHDMFPKARTLRWDADSATTPEMHDALLLKFKAHKADVMIGTQMVAKGLDLPLVTLVGVVSADVGLALPDFRAGERTFQLLTQVAGRAGRGLLGGQVVLQTYQPQHYAIQAASKHDYRGFYEGEIARRRDMGYPPFRRLVRLLIRQNSEAKAQSEAQRAAEMLRTRVADLEMTGTEIIGPAPCFFTRVNNVFRWQLLLRGPNPAAAFTGLDIPQGWYVDVDPVEVL